MTGLFVAIDGPKLVGKTTLVSVLRQRSDTAGWVFTKEPTEHFDLSNEQCHDGRKLAEYIAQDRARHVTEVIQPAIRDGLVVVTDRYVLSSFVFHCLDGVNPAAVAELNSSFPPPDVLLVLVCSPATLHQRRVGRSGTTRLTEVISPEDDVLGYLT